MLSGLYNWATGKSKDPYSDLTYGTYTNQDGTTVGLNEDMYKSVVGTNHGGTLSKTDNSLSGTIGGWFEPQGQSGASTAGNVLSGVGTAVNIGSGLAGMYYANKKAKLDKERAKMEKDVYQRGVQREAQAEARMQQFAKNAGNGAFYA